MSRHYKANNNRFAQAVWGRPWGEVYGQDASLRRRPQNSYIPPSVEEMVAMQRIADHLLLRIHRRLQPRRLHWMRERLERIGSRLIGTI